jgi:lipopolysaccharide heptosyltransferase I
VSDGDCPHFLIVRLSAIGDVLHGVPVLNALRAHFPRARLSWVVEGRAGELLRGHAALDRLIVAPRGWLKSPAAVWRLWRELRADRPDVALDLQGLARSALTACFSGARQRLGFAGKDGREFSRWLYTTLVQPTAAHVIDRNLQLLRPLGIHQPAVRFDLPGYEAETLTIAHYVWQRALGPFAVINPGAGWPSKRWEMDRFAAVAAHLGQHHGLPSVVVWAGAEERAWAEQIVRAAAGHAFLAPDTTLRELAALLRRACLFVGSDTGPMHLAAAVGTPCVALFGPVAARRNGPYGPGHIAVQQMCLTGSRRRRRGADNATMRAIAVADVTEACDRVLAERRTGKVSA